MNAYAIKQSRLIVLRSYPNPTREQLLEIIEIHDYLVDNKEPLVLSIPFTIEDCESLRDGWSFDWNINGVTLDIYNSDTNPRDEDE